MQIILQPLAANLDSDTFRSLASDISKEFENVQVTVAPSVEPYTKTIFHFSFERPRNQVNSTRLLQWFLDKFRIDRQSKMLIIVDADAYSSGLNFVFGEAHDNGKIAAIYLPRLKQEFYGLEPNEQIFYDRIVKEAVHELGHAFGLAHCSNKFCVMHFSDSLPETDIKRRRFCRNCKNKLL
jgi:archaemetzincin